MTVNNVSKLARELNALRREVRGNSASPQLSNSSIEGGSVDVVDETGNLLTKIGLQGDGTYSVGYNIGSTQITDEAVTTPKLAANSVTADKVEAESVAAAVGSFVKVNANQINTGILSATVTLSGTVQTAATGERSVMDSTGFKAYNASNKLIFSTTGGNVSLTGTLSTAAPGSPGTIIKPGPTTAGFGNSTIQIFTGVAGETGPSEITAQVTNGYPSLSLLGASTTANKDASVRPALYLAYGPDGPQVNAMAPQVHLGNGATGGQNGIYTHGPTYAGGDIHLVSNKFVYDGVLPNYSTNFVQSDWPVKFTKVNSTTTQDVQARGFIADTVISSPQVQCPAGVGAGGRMYFIGPSGSSLTLGADASNAPFLQSLSVWGYTTSGSANVAVDSYGTIKRSVSLEKYKVNIDRTPEMDLAAIKKLTPTTYYDKGNAERYNELVEKCPPGFIGPLPDINAAFPQRMLGLIAEDVAATGIHELNTYDSDGNLAGVAYDRVAVALIPWLRDNDKRIEALEAANSDLTKRIEALEGLISNMTTTATSNA